MYGRAASTDRSHVRRRSARHLSGRIRADGVTRRLAKALRVRHQDDRRVRTRGRLGCQWGKWRRRSGGRP